jgi:choline dehydrogenase-like flavoprotein
VFISAVHVNGSISSIDSSAGYFVAYRSQLRVVPSQMHPEPGSAVMRASRNQPVPASYNEVMIGSSPASVGTLIIGSGMAGAGLANELLDRGHRDFAVISSGSSQPDSASRTLTSADDPAWTSTNLHYQPIPGVVGRIGGRSKLWAGVTLRIPAKVLDNWPSAVAARLPDDYASVEGYLTAWKGAALDKPTCPADANLAQALSHCDPPFRVVPIAATIADQEKRTWRAYSPVEPLIERISSGSTCSVVPALIENQRVLWIEKSAGRLAVMAMSETTAGRQRITADKIALAAGTLENTRIFAQTLHHITGTEISAWPGLASKIKHGIFTRPAAWMTRDLGLYDSIYLLAEMPSAKENLFIYISSDHRGEPYLDLWWFTEQAHAETAVIHFDTRPPVWRGVVDCEIGQTDRSRILERDSYANALLRSWGCQEADLRDAAFPSRAEALTHLTERPVRYQNWVGLSDHESGTIALGEHLDDQFMSWRIPNLYVSGPSTFPQAGAANPSLTILALARFVAENL